MRTPLQVNGSLPERSSLPSFLNGLAAVKPSGRCPADSAAPKSSPTPQHLQRGSIPCQPCNEARRRDDAWFLSLLCQECLLPSTRPHAPTVCPQSMGLLLPHTWLAPPPSLALLCWRQAIRKSPSRAEQPCFHLLSGVHPRLRAIGSQVLSLSPEEGLWEMTTGLCCPCLHAGFPLTGSGMNTSRPRNTGPALVSQPH